MATLTGTSGSDSLVGDASGDVIDGFGGNDTLSGTDGADVLFGGDGNDILFGDGGTAATGTPTGPNLIQNGSFEDVTGLTAVDYGHVSTNGTLPGGWTATGGVIDIHIGTRGGVNATDGNRWLDSEGTTGQNITIGQNVTLTAGQNYLLRFDAGDFSSADDGTANDNTFEVIWNGEVIANINPVDGAMGTHEFVITGGTGNGANRIEFRTAGRADAMGAAIDNVRLFALSTDAPEAGNDSLFGGAGNDQLQGGGGNDSLDGGTGTDSMFGGDGDDSIIGGTGTDYVEGGAGNDILFGDSGTASVPTPVGPNLIQNGSFEDVTGLTATGYGHVSTNGTLPGGWTATGGDIDIHIGTRGGAGPTDGNRWLDSEGGLGQNITIGQNVTVTAGEDYLLRFDAGDFASADDGTANDNTFEVIWNGQVIAVIDPIDGAMGNHEFVVTGGTGNGTNRIEFRTAGRADAMGAAIDNVQLFALAADAPDSDSLFGGADNDQLFGGAGNDVLDGGTGDDTIFGGDGDDFATGGAGSDTVYGDDGNDNLRGGGGDDAVYGGRGNDYLSGEAGQDSLFGGDDADLIEGYGGNDYAEGGAGNDTISDDSTGPWGRGDGNDTFLGGDGNDILIGGLGNDFLYGGADDDQLRGDEGDDLLDGGAGNDSLLGGAGNDTLNGGAGADTLFGGDGDDRFVVAAGAGSATIDGGETAETSGDTLDATALGEDVVLTYTDATGRSGTLVHSGGTITFTGIETVLLAGNDTIIGADDPLVGDSLDGGAGNDRLEGRAGNDTLLGGTGNDTLDGGAGNDSLNGGTTGQDTLFGGAGDDTLAGGSDRDLLEGGDGNDLLYGALPTSGFFEGRDTLYGGDGDDTIIGSSTASGLNGALIDGGAGADSVTGSGATDTIDGGAGNDTLRGGGGADVIDGGSSGADLIFGGAGNDTIQGGTEADTLHGDAGDDLIYGDLSAGGTSTTGDTLYGGDGNDTLVAAAGATLTGSLLEGGSGNDLLQGSGQDDTLTGGTGADTLTGGAGADLFVVDGSADLITDFDPTGNRNGNPLDGDRVDLSAFYNATTVADWNAANPGQQVDDALDLLRLDQADGVLDLAGGLRITNGGSAVSALDLTDENTGVICFVRGTLIATPDGPIPIERLRPGDRVNTLENGAKPILWIGGSTVDGRGRMAPIRFAPGVLGNNRALSVSPQHRVWLRSRIAERMFGHEEVLVAAKALLDLPGVSREEIPKVEYFHFLLDRHELIHSDGAVTETLFTGPEALKSVSAEAQREILTLFPMLSTLDHGALLAGARPFVSVREGRKLAERHHRNARPLVTAPWARGAVAPWSAALPAGRRLLEISGRP